MTGRAASQEPVACRRGKGPGARGFTLVELLIVLVIIGISTALVGSGMVQLLTVSNERKVVENFTASLYSMRTQALGKNRLIEARLRYSGELVAGAEGDAALFSLPTGYSFKPALPESTEESVRLGFYGDGSAVDASFSLITPSARTFRFRIQSLTGAITMESGAS